MNARVRNDSEVASHRISVLVWGTESAVIAAEDVVFTVGIKCSAGCDLAMRRLEVHDNHGALIEKVMVPNQIWPGSQAIYFVTLSMKGPTREGQSTWEVRVVPDEEDPPHVSTPAQFAIRTVPKADYDVVVKVSGPDGTKPLERAIVCLHPFRAMTDATGLATLRVPKGDYRLLVSSPRHAPMSRIVTIAGDYSTSIELMGVKTQNPFLDWNDID